MSEAHEARDPMGGRLDELRNEAARNGTVSSRGVDVSGGPLPAAPADGQGAAAGYHGLPLLKPPVWTWEIPLYFFVGGLGGMAAVLALAAWAIGDARDLATDAAWLAFAAGGIVSPLLLVADLGRPRRFLNMLRVLKPQSAMSVGAWVLTAFGACAVVGAGCAEWYRQTGAATASVLTWLALVPAALLGAVLATYTGVLIGATAVPAWQKHHRVLPVHFGVAGLGSAAAALELLGHPADPLHLIGIAAAAGETVVGLIVELTRHGAADRALRTGRAHLLLRAPGLLAGPGSLALRLVGLPAAAAIAFLVGALVMRFGWLDAGRRSATDPEAALAAAAAG